MPDKTPIETLPPPGSAPADIQELITKRARQAWLFPVIVWIAPFGIGWIPIVQRLPHFLFTILAFVRIASLFWGLFRAVGVWQYRRQIPSVKPHAIAAFCLCGIPLVLGTALFIYAVFLPAGKPPFWIGK